MPKLVPMLRGGFDGGNDFRMRVAQNRRTPGADVINQFVAVHVPDLAPLARLTKNGWPPTGAKRAHGRIDAAGNIAQRLGKKFFGLNAIHRNKLTGTPPGKKHQVQSEAGS